MKREICLFRNQSKPNSAHGDREGKTKINNQRMGNFHMVNMEKDVFQIVPEPLVLGVWGKHTETRSSGFC